MQDRAVVQGWLDEIFYKPGWWFSSYEPENGNNVRVAIHADMVDSTTYPIDTSKTVAVGLHSYVPDHITNRADFYKWLQNQLFEFEKHESQEWLRCLDDGKPLNDPHEFDRRAG